jgi:excisionase family DNA binding protein
MNSKTLTNPYLQMSRLVGKDVDFEMVQRFVFKYIDDAIKYGGKSYPEASSDLKLFFVQLSDAVYQSSVSYDELKANNLDQNSNLIIDVVEDVALNDELLTVNDISEVLKVTPQQVRNLIKSNKLKSIKLSDRGTRVKKSDFEEFLISRNKN